MAEDRMQRQRFELKYVLDEYNALGVRHFASNHLELDGAGAGKPNLSYRVSSIYLDSDTYYTFWDWVNANRNRFKLRLRFYDESMETPVFFEIKRRVGNCILKQRCSTHKKAAPFVLNGQFPPMELIHSNHAKGLKALEDFITLTSRLNARPKAMVTYLREAYIDPDNDDVRLTMDREVRIAPRTEATFDLDMPEYQQPFGDKVILELKFNNRYPGWMQEMVDLFHLTRDAAAKYCEGIAAMKHPELGNRKERPAF